MKQTFTAEELAEMAAADAEIEAEFRLTPEDLKQSSELDREAKFSSLPPEKRKVAAQRKAYYEANREKVAAQRKAYREANREKVAAQRKAYREANREKVAAQQKAYREANREKVAEYQKAYYEANREKRRAYMREYMRRKRRMESHEAADAVPPLRGEAGAGLRADPHCHRERESHL